jgi:hypothetical protein
MSVEKSHSQNPLANFPPDIDAYMCIQVWVPDQYHCNIGGLHIHTRVRCGGLQPLLPREKRR